MADGGGSTEQDRSEGTPTKEGPNREQAPLVTWGAFPSNSPKAKQSAPRQTPLILILAYQTPPPTSVPELPAQPRRHATGIGLLPRTAWRSRPRPAVVPAVIGTLAVERIRHIVQHMHAQTRVPMAIATRWRSEVRRRFRARRRDRRGRRRLWRGPRSTGLRGRRRAGDRRNRLRALLGTLRSRMLNRTRCGQSHHQTQQGKTGDAIHKGSLLAALKGY
jgi:hypothetical protein